MKGTSNPFWGIVYGVIASVIGVAIAAFSVASVAGWLFGLVNSGLGVAAAMASFYIITTRGIPQIAYAHVNLRTFNGFTIGFISPVALVLIGAILTHPNSDQLLEIVGLVAVLLVMGVGLVNLKVKLDSQQDRAGESSVGEQNTGSTAAVK